MPSTVLAETNNFLLPNGTFFAELLIFLIVLFVLGRFVVPPVRKALAERQEMVRRQAEESQRASEQFEAAETRYREDLAEARGLATQIRDEARADARQVSEELRGQAESEVAGIRQRGAERLAEQRRGAVRRLRSELAPLSTALAQRLVGESLGADERNRDTIDGFLAELDGDQPAVTAGAR